VLDVATGSGDVPLTLARWARRRRVLLDVRGCDVSEVALGVARERTRAGGIAATIEQRDAVRDGLREGDASVDVVTCSLFLHHLSEEDAVGLLREMGRVARRCVVVSDLRRCGAGLAAAYVASRVGSRSRVVHVDAPRSVRAAFTEAELRGLAARAGLSGAMVARRWPFRMLLVWTRT
jgi:2-polyprenyl-3-methyl-5-hydroxy-6-metoxy-1,4-benzoquinol methylase